MKKLKFFHRPLKIIVLEWNENAINFYKRNGAKVLHDWRVAQMDLNAIKKFVGNENF